MSALSKFRAIASMRKIVAITAWDFPSGLLAETANIDLVLVGDSLGMCTLGQKDTKSVTLEEMIHHTRAVRRAVNTSFIMADLPFGTYEVSAEQAIGSAVRLIKEGGADGIKLEGGCEMSPTIAAITRSGIPVFGHIGVTPQRNLASEMTETENAASLLKDAESVENAGAVAIVLEGIPSRVASAITEALKIPTIGIGSGSACSGQLLLQTEVLGYQTQILPQWHKSFADIGEQSIRAMKEYVAEVIEGRFP